MLYKLPVPAHQFTKKCHNHLNWNTCVARISTFFLCTKIHKWNHIVTRRSLGEHGISIKEIKLIPMSSLRLPDTMVILWLWSWLCLWNQWSLHNFQKLGVHLRPKIRARHLHFFSQQLYRWFSWSVRIETIDLTHNCLHNRNGFALVPCYLSLVGKTLSLSHGWWLESQHQDLPSLFAFVWGYKDDQFFF